MGFYKNRSSNISSNRNKNHKKQLKKFYKSKKIKPPKHQCLSGFWRRRRDLNSRAGFPTYALSRGASSANLSTSPFTPQL